MWALQNPLPPCHYHFLIWGLCSFHQMLNKFKYCTPVLLLQEVAAYTHVRPRALTHSLTFLCQMSLLRCSQSGLLYYSKALQKRNWLQRRINSAQSHQKGCKKTNGPAWPCGSSHLIILLKWSRMHFSLCDHRAGVAFDWARLLAGSPPLWCVLINTTLIVPWCYFEAWKWAFFSIVSGLIPVGNIPVLQTKSVLWLAVSDKTHYL